MMDFVNQIVLYVSLVLIRVSVTGTDFVSVYQNKTADIVCHSGQTIQIDNVKTSSMGIGELVCNIDEEYNCTADYSKTRNQCEGRRNCTISGIDLLPIKCLTIPKNISVVYHCTKRTVQMTICFPTRLCWLLMNGLWQVFLNGTADPMYQCVDKRFKRICNTSHYCRTWITFHYPILYLPFYVNVSYSCLELNETSRSTVELQSNTPANEQMTGLITGLGLTSVACLLLGFVLGVVFAKRIKIRKCKASTEPEEEDHYNDLQLHDHTQHYDALTGTTGNSLVLNHEINSEVQSPTGIHKTKGLLKLKEEKEKLKLTYENIK